MNWILMADVIHSSFYSGNDLQKHFKEATEHINATFNKKLLSPLTITLGDEFQGVVKNLKYGKDIILELEEYIIAQELGFKLRYVIKYGKIDTPINPEIAYGMLGEGLSSARKLLEQQKKQEIRFEFETGKASKNMALNNAFYLLQNLQSKWNAADSKILALFFKYKDYKLISEKSGVSRSQIWKKEKSLNISSYFAIKKVVDYLAK